MGEWREELESRLQADQDLQKQLARLTANVPEGMLEIHHQGAQVQYLLNLSGTRKYISKTQMDTIKKLAEKSYHQKLKRQVDEEITVLSRFLKDYHPEKQRELFEAMSKDRQKLLNPLVLPNGQYLEQWRNTHEEAMKTHHNDFPVRESLKTLNGEFVRSKSEKMLADAFLHYGVPYYYEAPLKLAGRVIFPDFCLLNVRTRKEYYWEHFGLMDQAEYAEHFQDKVLWYERNGIWPGERLLMSFETVNLPIDVNTVESVIRKYLI